jgi:hypothetical protein
VSEGKHAPGFPQATSYSKILYSYGVARKKKKKRMKERMKERKKRVPLPAVADPLFGAKECCRMSTADDEDRHGAVLVLIACGPRSPVLERPEAAPALLSHLTPRLLG